MVQQHQRGELEPPGPDFALPAVPGHDRGDPHAHEVFGPWHDGNFVGVGVNTFYQAPEQRHQAEMQSVQRQIEDLNMRAPKDGLSGLSAEDQAKLTALTAQQRRLQDLIDAEMKGWARNTSIMLVLFATGVMAVSLVRSDQLRVVSNGLLMGGLFTMVYGSGWVLFSGKSVARFFVVLFALVVALALGYVKFVRGREERPVPRPGDMEMSGTERPLPSMPLSTSAEEDVWAGVLARLDRLEARTAAAATALGAPGAADERLKGGGQAPNE